MDLKYSVISNYFKDSTTLIEAAKHVNDGDMFCESKFEEETLHGTVDAFGQEYKVEVILLSLNVIVQFYGQSFCFSFER